MEEAKPPKGRKRSLVPLVLVGLLITIALVAIRFWPDPPPEPIALAPPPPPPGAPAEAAAPAEPGATIPFDPGEQDAGTQSMLEDRKKRYQVGQGVDMIARSDETVILNGNRISMGEIQELIRQKTGEIAEQSIGSDGAPTDAPIEMFGLYVVQPGDNIWDIHFRFLQDYFRNREVVLSPLADEPDSRGYSSGIGKLLKFSENLVYIYNVEEHALDDDLNVIEPFSKVLVYKMDPILDILDDIDPGLIDQIRFDGDTLWIPPAS